MTKPAYPAPPSDLSEEARRLWRQIHEGWVIDDNGRAILATALRADDRAAAARKLVEAEGYVVAFGKGTRAHPAVQIMKDAELIALKARRQLNLAGGPPGVPGRPPGPV